MWAFLQGLQFLTAIPVPQKKKLVEMPVADLEKLGRATAFFPFIGVLIGLVLVGVNFLGSKFLSNSVTNVLLIILLILIRGGLHLDGFIDTVDGLFSGKDREKILEIMRDSRVGAYGVTAVICLLLLKFTLLNSLTQTMKWKALILMPAMGQWAIVYAAALYPYARAKEGIGKVFAEKTGGREMALATLTVVFLSIYLFKAFSLAIMFGLLILTVLLSRFVFSKIQGFTGDTYGALAEVIEVWVLMMILIFSRANIG